MIRTPSSEKATENAAAPRCAVFVIGTISEARRALAIGRELAVCPVLLSPPDAASFMGSPWWLAMMDAVRRECLVPGSGAGGNSGPDECGLAGPAFIDILDCGAQAGRAASALALGQSRIVLHLECPQYRQVADLAASLNAEVIACRPEAYVVTADLTAERLRDCFRHFSAE
ncbi:hypothetical protein [Acetobacter fallax]|uniref:hypothetical protein n=1 Tax=Acetobacter fallax TaxID=1737473 RepID=UPI00156B091A|nr:hypothetical protein [Acetobacter fallax]